MEMSATLKACREVLHTATPKDSANTMKVLKDSLASNPDALSELCLNIVDFPLAVCQDGDRSFILCEFNRFGESHRSPFSNDFFPSIETDEQVLSNETRVFEEQINEVWDMYRQHYYGKDAVGSVYLKEIEGVSFVACFLIQKDIADERLQKGVWNSAHIVRASTVVKGSSKYSIQSTVWMSMDPTGETNMSSRSEKTTEEVHPVTHGNASHLENVGKMVESIEIDMRSSLENVHIPKTRVVVQNLRKEPVPEHHMGVPIKLPFPPGGVPVMGGHAAALKASVLKRTNKK